MQWAGIKNLRRQKKAEFPPTNEAAEKIENNVLRREGADLLDKKMVSSRR